MSALTFGLVLASAFATSVLSGVFGMAGGLVLMGVLLALTPVASAMVLHGAIQFAANGSRAFVHRRFVSWPIVVRYGAGSLAGGACAMLLVWRPEERLVFLMLGAVAMLVWTPRSLSFDINRPGQAVVCGALVQSLNIAAGVAGPLLDLFFARSPLDRRTVVATKAATQVIAHSIKIVVWAPILLRPETPSPEIPVLAGLIALCAPLTLMGAAIGGRILERMTDADFRAWTRWLITLTGIVYFARAALG